MNCSRVACISIQKDIFMKCDLFLLTSFLLDGLIYGYLITCTFCPWLTGVEATQPYNGTCHVGSSVMPD